MLKPKVKIDIDGVLDDMANVLVQMYNERNGAELRIEDCTRYDFSSYGSEVALNILSMLRDPELYERMRPTRNAVKYLWLIFRDFDAKLVTSTSPEELRLKLDWLHRWFGFVADSDIIVASDKKWIEADYVIDDHVGNLLGDGAYRILIDQPWNRSIRDYAFGICRVQDLKDAYEIIKTQESEVEEIYDQI